jgi:hypothetical protein
MNDELTCRHCGGPNETYYFVCPTCWQLLPQHLRRSFVVLKVRCFSWLRDFHPGHSPTLTPAGQSQPNNQSEGTTNGNTNNNR